MIAYKFSDLDYELGFKILKSYLIIQNIFGRIQKEARIELKKLDLDYIIKFPNNMKMNSNFIDRLDSTVIFNEIHVNRFEIKSYISSLDLYHEALILKRIYPDTKLKVHSKKLSKYEKEIDKLSYYTHRNHILKALNSLYDLIISAENDSELKAKIMSGSKSIERI